MSAPTFEIVSRFVSKDPEFEITYIERDARGTRRHRSAFLVDVVFVDALEAWADPPEPMTTDERERLLERLAAWCFSKEAPFRVLRIEGPTSLPLRLPEAWQAEASRSAQTWRITYFEPGRKLELEAVELTRDRVDDRRPRLLVTERAIPRAWQGGAPLTDEDRGALLARLRASPRFALEVEQSAAQRDAWTLAEELVALSGMFVVMLAPSEVATLSAFLEDAVRPAPAPRAGPAARHWLARVELPALVARTKTGWNVDGARAWLGPIAAEGLDVVRSALFADALPFAPDATPTGETRATLWAWNTMRKQGAVVPDELAGRGAGVVLERRSTRGVSILAMYEDGRIRYVGPHGAIACEPGAAPSVPGIGLAVRDAPPGARDPSELAIGEARLTVLTCSGASVVRGDGLEVPRVQAERALRGLLESMFPTVFGE